MLLTGMPSQHMGLDAPDAFPMAPETGPSIAEPELRPRGDGLLQPGIRPPKTGRGSSADSAAAIQ